MSDTLVGKGLTVFRGGRKILDSVEVSAESGSILAILGPNGAGKSTLLSALAGLLPFEGTLRLGDLDLRRLPAIDRAKAVAYVPQRSHLDAALYVRAVVEQGRFPHRGAFGAMRAVDHRAVDEAMRRADVEGLAARRFDELSVGERRRVLLARALATHAKVLLLDEPTAALDVGHELDLHEVLRALAGEGLAVLVVLHGLDAARRHTDRALLLDGGVTVASGPTAEVVTDERVRGVYGVRLLEDAALAFRREPS